MHKLRALAVAQGWRSPAWPLGSGPEFLNTVALIETDLGPLETLKTLLRIEKKFGRVRQNDNQNAPRTLDLDLLDWHGRCLTDEGLSLPHPRLHQRAFVLGPLAEVLPDWRHPASGISVQDLLAACDPSQAARPSGEQFRIPAQTMPPAR